jgi:putative tryptophan/tyrosine transport system substrate-binding protein
LRRRRLLALLSGLSVAFPLFARSQQGERPRRIGVLTVGLAEDQSKIGQIPAFVQRMRELGWVKDRNLAIEYRFPAGRPEHIRENARELVQLEPDVILSTGGPALNALLEQTRTIPIVFTNISEPVGSGFVVSLARPGGNATGFSAQEGAIAGKWLELLKIIAPQVTRGLVVMEADSQPQLLMRDAVVAAAPTLDVRLATLAVHDLVEAEHGIEAFAREPGGGLVVLPNGITTPNREQIYGLTTRHRLPAIYSYPFFARGGGLISYGVDTVAQFREAAGYVDRILRGEKPGDLPVQLPTKFVLVINMKTARALGLVVPQSLLDRADEVIE